jgi:hypothetical protein
MSCTFTVSSACSLTVSDGCAFAYVSSDWRSRSQSSAQPAKRCSICFASPHMIPVGPTILASSIIGVSAAEPSRMS